MKKKQIENIQALRGVAALLVFAAHIKGAEIDYGGGGELLFYGFRMGVAGVDLFFVISGFVMVHVASAMSGGIRSSSRFLFNRGARIYPLYWVATLLLLVLYAGKKYFFGEDTAIVNPFASAFLLPDKAFPILTVGWTLVHEVYFYAVFSLFVLFPRRALPFLIVGWAVLIAAGDALGWRSVNAWTAIAFSPLTFEFIAGCAIAFIVRRWPARFGMLTFALGVAWLALPTALFAHQLYPGVFEDQHLRVLLFLPPFTLVLYGAITLETESRTTAPHWLRRTGDASYSLYLIHLPVVLVIGKLISLIAGPGWFDNIILICLATTAGLVTAFCIHKWIEKPGLNLTRRLGDRFFKSPPQKAIAQDRAW